MYVPSLETHSNARCSLIIASGSASFIRKINKIMSVRYVHVLHHLNIVSRSLLGDALFLPNLIRIFLFAKHNIFIYGSTNITAAVGRGPVRSLPDGNGPNETLRKFSSKSIFIFIIENDLVQRGACFNPFFLIPIYDKRYYSVRILN